MKLKIKETKEVEVKYLRASCGVRYWEDADVNGIEDSDGSLIPLRDGDYWCPVINIETGRIKDWPIGTKADIHYKICDDGTYELLDKFDIPVMTRDGYVPDIMSPSGASFGDYVIMKVDDAGYIKDWKADLYDFMEGSTS